MESKMVLWLTILVILSVTLVTSASSSSNQASASSSGNQAKINCTQKKFEDALDDSYDLCVSRSGGLQINKIKTCFTDYLKAKQVVPTNGQMVVNREKFGDFGKSINSTVVGRGVQECYNAASAGDDMYKEAARATQCVFGKVKLTCN